MTGAPDGAVVGAGPPDAVLLHAGLPHAGLPDAGIPTSVGGVLLHGPAHAAEGSTAVPVEYAAGGMAFAVLLGGLLLWYYERRLGST